MFNLLFLMASKNCHENDQTMGRVTRILWVDRVRCLINYGATRRVIETTLNSTFSSSKTEKKENNQMMEKKQLRYFMVSPLLRLPQRRGGGSGGGGGDGGGDNNNNRGDTHVGLQGAAGRDLAMLPPAFGYITDRGGTS